MQKERLNFSHRNLLQDKLKNLHLSLSEYSFATLYLFRHIHAYELLFGKELYIQGKTREDETFIMPTSLPSSPSLSTLAPLLAETGFLFPIPEEWLSIFQSNSIQMSFKDSDSDYLFRADRFKTFPGRALQGKRNLVKQLFKSYAIKAEWLAPNQKEKALNVLNIWQEQQPVRPEDNDYFPCREAIELCEELRLSMRIISLEGQPKGLLIGEWLNQACYVIHFSKADKEIKGLYQYLYQNLAQSLGQQAEWINIEQDLGLPSLRQAKQSYHPDCMLHKWRISVRE